MLARVMRLKSSARPHNFAPNDLKHPINGLGAMDYLNEVITSNRVVDGLAWTQRTDGPEGGKASFIRNTIRQYRELAQNWIMNDPEFADFAEYVEDRAARHRRERWPYADIPQPEVPRIRPPVMGTVPSSTPPGAGDE
jgi:hypothetical protein